MPFCPTRILVRSARATKWQAIIEVAAIDLPNGKDRPIFARCANKIDPSFHPDKVKVRLEDADSACEFDASLVRRGRSWYFTIVGVVHPILSLAQEELAAKRRADGERETARINSRQETKWWNLSYDFRDWEFGDDEVEDLVPPAALRRFVHGQIEVVCRDADLWIGNKRNAGGLIRDDGDELIARIDLFDNEDDAYVEFDLADALRVSIDMVDEPDPLERMAGRLQSLAQEFRDAADRMRKVG